LVSPLPWQQVDPVSSTVTWPSEPRHSIHDLAVPPIRTYADITSVAATRREKLMEYHQYHKYR